MIAILFTPCSASFSAIPRPIPRDAPVIRAVCCVSVIGITPSRSRVRIDRIDLDLVYYTLHMSMGKRIRERQPEMWVATTDFPTAASHPFYSLSLRTSPPKLNSLCAGRRPFVVGAARECGVEMGMLRWGRSEQGARDCARRAWGHVWARARGFECNG